ncbi:MAG: prolipoprotein diacylglyceryl transferase, partial [bacterium]
MYPILLDLGFWQLRSYGVFVAIAVLVGIWWSTREAERRGFARSLVYDAAWAITIAGFAGARLWYALFSEPGAFLANPWEIFAVWHGGLSMHGALVAGTAVGAWWIRRQRLPFWRFGDAVAPGLILGQAVGQIACLLNGDTYGKPTYLPWAIVFTHPHAMA